ncbi:hypothetical protein B0I21_106126 [Sphingobacterium paludis]|uniref:Uncharacterized protein n=1 Tax=Sphingobacterium paludis TaxID=1476465 RepID=A0A4R7CVQ8_9SPHI|nr:hypothetical protein B0I21_106126 [Sphingobacterium paludis]
MLENKLHPFRGIGFWNHDDVVAEFKIRCFHHFERMLSFIPVLLSFSIRLINLFSRGKHKNIGIVNILFRQFDYFF